MSKDEYVIDDSGEKVWGAKSDIRIMNQAMAAVYEAEDGPRPQSHYKGTIADSNSAPNGWLSRQVSKMTQGGNNEQHPDNGLPAPKNARVCKWMDRHESRMLDPNWARASIVSSAVTDLGPPPSVSPASVVPDRRESILSEMGQIRRDAVPPALDLVMVERVRKMKENGEDQYTLETAMPTSESSVISAPAPAYQRVAPSAIGTESTWTSWGVDDEKR